MASTTVPEPLPDNVVRHYDWVELDFHDVFAARYAAFPSLSMERLGANVEIVLPGNRTCPLHAHLFEEEVFVVLEGTLTVRELEPGAEDYREFELHAGELVVYPPDTGLAHGFSNRGEVEARHIALSDKHQGEVCTYPDSGKVMLQGLGKVGYFGEPVAVPRRGVVRLRDEERPRHVVTLDALAERNLGRAFGIQASRAGGATAVMVNRDRLPPGGATSPLHWHSANEELVFVLSGAATLRQLRGSTDGKAPDFEGANEERVALQVGDIVHFGPKRPVAHQILNESDDDVLLLVVGTDSRRDVCVFPERGRIHVAALGRSDEFTPTDYFEGEV